MKITRHLNFCSWASPVRAPWSPLGSLWSPLGLPGGPWDTPGTTFEVLLHLSGPMLVPLVLPVDVPWATFKPLGLPVDPLLPLLAALWPPLGSLLGPLAVMFDSLWLPLDAL